jgi:fatty acid desaturase
VNSSPNLPANPSASESNLSVARSILTPDVLQALNARSTSKGLLRLTGHLLILMISGYLWGTNLGHHWAIALPALLVYGYGFAAMFAPMHESSHRTAFENNTLNDWVCWFAGVLSFYNGTFYRRYHKWHHRYVQDPAKDPELSEPLPKNFWAYLWVVSGLPWWWGKLITHLRVASGNVADYPYISEEARGEVILSTRLQLGVYWVAIALSIAAHHPWFITYWLFPLFVAQPILRCYLFAEHTGCTNDDNPLTNTRSTYTLFPMRFIMWNMPFHAEHHLYPSIPFHQLPAAHEHLKPHLAHIGQGYIRVNREIVAGLAAVQFTMKQPSA